MATSRKLWSDKLSAVGKSGAAVSSRNIFAEKSLKKARTCILQDSLGAFAPPVQFEGVILGVDPSLRGTGLAVLKIAKGSRPLYLNSMTVKKEDAKITFSILLFYIKYLLCLYVTSVAILIF